MEERHIEDDGAMSKRMKLVEESPPSLDSSLDSVDDVGSSTSCSDDSNEIMNGMDNEGTSRETSLSECSLDNSSTQEILPHSLQGIHMLDISDYCPPRQADDATKYQLILARRPEKGYVFPPRRYIDKRKKDGITNRRCNIEWFDMFDFLCYSKAREGLFCLCCVLFPSDVTANNKGKGLITVPYTHWKDAKRDIFSHSYLGYHMESKAKMDSFMQEMRGCSTNVVNSSNLAPQVMVVPSGEWDKNTKFLACVLKAVEVCGRQGFVSDSHKSGSASNDLIKAILDVRIDSGDLALREHLELCQMTAKYTSKSCQNDLLQCVKHYIQSIIVKEIQEQIIGPLYGIRLEEISGEAHSKYLGIVLRYVHNNEPVERLIDFLSMEEINDRTLLLCVKDKLESLGLEVVKCGSQCYDTHLRLTNEPCLCSITQPQKSAGKLFSHIPCFHSGNNILNSTLCKTSCVKQVHFVIYVMEMINKFLKDSPSRQQGLIKALTSVRPLDRYEIRLIAMKTFSEATWSEQHTAWEDLTEIYEGLVESLKAIITKPAWDGEDLSEAWTLLNLITSCDFIVPFQVCRCVLGYTLNLSVLLHGSLLYVSTVYSRSSQEVIKALEAAQSNSLCVFQQVFSEIESMCRTAGARLSFPQCIKHIVPCDTPDELQDYFRESIFNKFLNCVLKHIAFLFSDMFSRPEGLAVNALLLIPSNLGLLSEEKVQCMRSYFGNDLPIPATLPQEINLWKVQWNQSTCLPATLAETLKATSKEIYPNIYSILHILALTPVDRHSQRFVAPAKGGHLQEVLQSTLMLLHVNNDIPLQFGEIVTMYAKKFPDRMLLVNPLSGD